MNNINSSHWAKVPHVFEQKCPKPHVRNNRVLFYTTEVITSHGYYEIKAKYMYY